MSTVRSLRTLRDLGADGMVSVLERSAHYHQLRGRVGHPRPLVGKSVALIFEKPSTRTRVSFEVAVAEMGGHPLVLHARDLQIGRGEPIEDTARVLSRYVHAIVYRTFAQASIDDLARCASVPVVNALSDAFHPCQVLADLYVVLRERETLDGLRVAWIGDGNNVACSWINAAALLGFEVTLACPSGYEPDPDVLAWAHAQGRGRVRVVRDPREAAAGAHVVTTDVWASMGQEQEAQQRRERFAGYLVDADLMALADDGVVFLHCLPAHRGEEVTADVIDGPRSRVWDEAEARLHTQKALLEWVLG